MEARLAKVFVIAVSIVAVTVGIYTVGIRTIGISANDVRNSVSPFWQPWKNRASRQPVPHKKTHISTSDCKNIEFVYKNFPMKSGAKCGNLADILKRGEMVICARKERYVACCQMQTKDGYIGEDVRLATELGNALGVKIIYKMVYDTYDDVVEAIYNCEGDVGIANLSYTPTRAKKVMFSSPYVILNKAILINRLAMVGQKARNLSEILNVPAAKIAALKNTSNENFAKEIFSEAQILGEAEWETGAIKKLQQTEVVAVVDDNMLIGTLIMEQPNLLLKFLPVILKESKDPISAITNIKEYSLNLFINKFLENKYKILSIPEVLETYRDYIK